MICTDEVILTCSLVFTADGCLPVTVVNHLSTEIKLSKTPSISASPKTFYFPFHILPFSLALN